MNKKEKKGYISSLGVQGGEELRDKRAIPRQPFVRSKLKINN